MAEPEDTLKRRTTGPLRWLLVLPAAATGMVITNLGVSLSLWFVPGSAGLMQALFSYFGVIGAIGFGVWTAPSRKFHVAVALTAIVVVVCAALLLDGIRGRQALYVLLSAAGAISAVSEIYVQKRRTDRASIEGTLNAHMSSAHPIPAIGGEAGMRLWSDEINSCPVCQFYRGRLGQHA